jgi:hypothetical protein
MATHARDLRAMRHQRDLPPSADRLERKRQAVLIVALLLLIVIAAIIALAPT